MSGFCRKSLKHSVDEDFFKFWSRQMAYVLGFTFADGNIYRTSLTWDIQKRDLDLLQKINKVTNSTYPISIRKNSYRLRINNQIFIKWAIKKGLLPKKNMRKILPSIPSYLARHFIRGYLDGDGWVVIRNGKNEGDVGFASGSKEFLKLLNISIKNYLNILPAKVRRKVKITPKGVRAITYQLEYYSSNAFKIAKWVYGNLSKEDIYLERKYQKYLLVKNLYDFLNSGTRKVRVIQRERGKNIKEILEKLYIKKRMDGVQIAKELGVHSSSAYRWLAKTGIKYPVKRKKKSIWTKI